MSGLSGFVGKSHSVTILKEQVYTAAPSKATVLIQGESGTGKQRVAHAIHLNSDRAGPPFISTNCAAIPEGLLETELFGHERGAFTSADRQRKGKFEMADGGTLFLDEIGELSLAGQVKLLRVLQQEEVEPVGGDRVIRVDVRVVAATNRNLEKMVAAGTFRSDLFFRLNVFSTQIPSLRERLDDIPELTDHFVLKYAPDTRRTVRGSS